MNKNLQINVIIIILMNIFINELQALNIEKLTTNNGLKLWINHDKRLPMVHIVISFKNCGYIYDERNNQGISSVIKQIIDDGLLTENPTQYKEDLYNKNIKIDCNVEPEYFTFHIQATKADIDYALSLFKEATSLKNIYNKNLFNIKNNIINNNDNDDNFIENFLNIEYKKLFFPNHPYTVNYVQNNQKNFFNNEKIIQKYISIFNRSNLMISIIGNINSTTINKIDYYLNHLHFKKNNKKIASYQKIKPKKIIFQGNNNIESFAFLNVNPQDIQYHKYYLLNKLLSQKYLLNRLNLASKHELNFLQGQIIFLARQNYTTEHSNNSFINNLNLLIDDEMITNIKQKILHYLYNLEKNPMHYKAKLLNEMQLLDLPKNFYATLIMQLEDLNVSDFKSFTKSILSVKKLNQIIIVPSSDVN